MNWPRISVVVCSFNGAATIRDTLEGLRTLRYPDFEIIVVNDGSTDATADIAADYECTVISTENHGLSNARNTGWRAASGEIVAYIDDDAYPDPDWLNYLALRFLETSCVGVGGPNIAPAGDGWIADCVANAPGGPVHVLLSDTEAEHIPGCNMAFRREALEAVDGFDGRYRAAGDDVDLCWRLQDRGWKIRFSASAVVWHHRRNSIRMYWKQQLGYGKAEALLEEKWPQKYNMLGHYAWSGRLYGKGLTRALRSNAAGVYQGQSDTAAQHSMHIRETGFLATLPLMPEWFILIAVLATLTLLGLNWQPLLWTAPILLLACVALLAQAALSAAKAEFPTPATSALDHSRRLFVTGMLHLLQPIARLKGRLEHGLTPWRARARVSPTWRLTATRNLRSSVTLSPRAWRERIAGLAGEDQMVVREGEDRDDWDLEVSGGLLGSARMLLAIDDDQTGGQALRVRSWMRVPRAGFIASCVGIVLAAMAAQQGAWPAAVAISIAIVALGTGMLSHSGAALSALQLLLTKLDEQQCPDPAPMTPVIPTNTE
jgi:GT2 family glycosyltransferase